MEKLNVNKDKLVEALKKFAVSNKKQKVDIRSKSMADWREWYDLRNSQQETTVLCVLRAFTRGRVHRHQSTLELEAQYLEENRGIVAEFLNETDSTESAPQPLPTPAIQKAETKSLVQNTPQPKEQPVEVSASVFGSIGNFLKQVILPKAG